MIICDCSICLSLHKFLKNMEDLNREQLKKLIEQIDSLKTRIRFSVEFKSWKAKVERFLGRTWKDQPEYLEQFKEIIYSPGSTIIPRYEHAYEKQNRIAMLESRFKNGLDEAKLRLESFLDEIPNEGNHKIVVEVNLSERKKIQKSLSLLISELSSAESGPDSKTFGFKHRLKEIFKDLSELEPKFIAEYSELRDLPPLDSYDALDYTRGDSGMAQLLKSRINKLLIETNYDEPQSENTIDKIQVLENIFEKFPRVARQLKERRNEKGIPRPTLEINDEYDVQDLLRSILNINFEIVKNEIGTEYHAGGTAKMDLVLDDEEIVIEVKMVRKDHTLRTLGDELIIDIERYLNKYSCKFLYFFIYDPTNILPNLPELVKDINQTRKGVVIRVVFAPRK